MDPVGRTVDAGGRRKIILAQVGKEIGTPNKVTVTYALASYDAACVT